jgi:hypothetical protein
MLGMRPKISYFVHECLLLLSFHFAKCLIQIVSHMHVYVNVVAILHSLWMSFYCARIGSFKTVARTTQEKEENFLFDPRRFDQVKPIRSALGPIRSELFWSNPLGLWDHICLMICRPPVGLILCNCSLMLTEPIMCNEEKLFRHVVFKMIYHVLIITMITHHA